ncbi:tyrosyl-DNA phosphodiesterase-domain-containing protein [Gautieria morchelliformis]|nr:tyrosyl-DNA phosphodiesterase-domain-containing protein [Gautieria morchelliformis]
MSSDDEDLKLAIARSLAETNIRQEFSSKDDPIVVSSDDDEPHRVARPKPHLGTSSTQSRETMNLRVTEDVPMIAPTTSNSFLSERAQLEAARLARLKRMRGSEPLTETRKNVTSHHSLDDPFVSSDEDEVPGPPAKKSRLCVAATSNGHAKTASSRASLKPAPTVQPRPSGSRLADAINGRQVATSVESDVYWTGELRQTANMQVPSSKDTRPIFRLHDILGNKSELTFVVLSSFVTQLSWIYSLLPPIVPVLLIGQPDAKGSASVHNVLPNWVRVTPALRGGRGCMHMKFMLLFYKSGRMRVVISTANLVDYDWRDIENSVWLQDIPPRPHVIPRDPKADDFATQFEFVLDALGVRDGLGALRVEHRGLPLRSVSDLRCGWDFGKVRVQLVSSIAGKHEGWHSVLRVGHVRLMAVVRLIGARADALDVSKGNRKGKGKDTSPPGQRDLEIECQGSSIGTYTPAWIDEFLCSARGASPEFWLDDVKTRRVKALDARLARDGWASWSNLKILFPSLQTVKMSRLGEDGAGTMFCQRRQWNGPKFPRQLFHDSNSKRGPVLMHSKMILATFKDASSRNLANTAKTKKAKAKAETPDPDSSVTESSSDSDVEEIDTERDANVIGWLYVGSHNFTASAWGTLSGSRFTPIMNITNFELGIVMPLTDPKHADEFTCWHRPPRRYNLEKDEPWIQNSNG